MKILHVTKKYPDALGGDAFVVSNLQRYQRSRGSDVVILTSNCDVIRDSPRVQKFGLRTTTADLDRISPKRLASLIMLFFKSFTLLRRERPDIVHTHSIDLACFVSFAARHYGIPIVHTFHVLTFNNSYQSTFRRTTELLLLAAANPKTTIVLNPVHVHALRKAGFRKTTFIPNGVDAAYWRTEECRRRQLTFTFIAVGRLEDQKGFRYLIEAAGALRGAVDDFQIQIVGDGSLRGALSKQIDDLNLAEHVFLLGHCSQRRLRDLYCCADVFVQSSLWEGMALALLEACAAGLPSICTAVSGLPEMDEEYAIFVAPGDYGQLASAMRQLMADQATRDALGAAATRIASRYSWESIGAQVSRVYARELDRANLSTRDRYHRGIL